MSGLDNDQRKALSRLVSSARVTLFDDAERTLRGTYGILRDGTIQSEAGLAPDHALRARRRNLEAVIAHLRADGTSAAAAVERLTREVAFTHLNRLLAIRVADALGVIAPSLRDGAQSAGFRQWISDLAPLLATADDTGGYWTYLRQCADELAKDAPALFDPRNPLLALRPTKAAFDTVVALFADPANAAFWDADDTFGWAYQFFNTRDERQAMRKSSAPQDTRELAVRNQFFTPDYVVRFLVHNSLGRRLVDADPSTPLLDQLSLLIDPPTIRGTPVDLAQVKVLDPACGSGHFLLGCYDVLEAAWQLAGVSPADAAAWIVPCLWGVDIDPRAVQVAQAAIVFRARRSCGRSPLPPPNVICARALSDDAAAWKRAQVGLDANLRHLVDAMRTALRDAPVLGPLLKAEQRLAGEIRSTVIAADDTGDDLFSAAGIAHDIFGNAERAVITALQRAADATSATPAEQLLAAGASDAVRFVEAMRNRYDAILMNPPFGEPVASTKDYIKAAYPWIPTKDFNLLAAFVGRGIELCKAEGYVGAITSRGGLFINTYQAWRTDVLLGNRFVALADLGSGVMDATVEAAAYVLSPARSETEPPGVYIRLLKEADRSAALSSAVVATRRGQEDSRVFRISSAEFATIPGSPMAYWMSDSIRRLFTELPRLEGNGADVRQGLATGDDFRFVRLFWEVDPRAIAQTREETNKGKRWVPFAKGGEYSPYWSDVHLVINFERDGRTLREFKGSVIRNPQYYFRSGLTWPRRTQGGFNPSVLPAGCAFGDKGPGVFAQSNDDSLAVLAGLLVRPSLLVIGSLTTFGSYEVGALQRMPMVDRALDDHARQDVVDATARVVRGIAEVGKWSETCRQFEEFSPESADGIRRLTTLERRRRIKLSCVILADLATIDRLYSEALGLDDDALAFLGDQLGPPVWGDRPGLDNDVNHAANPLGPYLIDRELEGTARSQNLPLEAAATQLLGMEPNSELVAARAVDLVSWLVGVAMGRWDARGAKSPDAFDLFASVPLCPPGMLVGEDGFPSTVPPTGYPFALPADGVLLDQKGHLLDLPSAVEAAAAALATGYDLLADAIDVLGRRDLRDYLAKSFFRDHLGRYSKSRRQAPVYWQLTIPSGQWSTWLYAPRFSREMLYAVVTLADHRLAGAAERVRSLQEDTSGSARQRAKLLDDERTLSSELKELRDDVARLAGLGWQPDLNDGFVLCAAPLARWFPRNTWRQLPEQLSAIRRGEYAWATIHMYRDVL
jgi:SAM-dependent methyltransferase